MTASLKLGLACTDLGYSDNLVVSAVQYEVEVGRFEAWRPVLLDCSGCRIKQSQSVDLQYDLLALKFSGSCQSAET